MRSTVLIVPLLLLAVPVAARAQGISDGSDWSFRAPKPAPLPKRKPANAATAEEAERAARLAEARRRFFTNQPDDGAKPDRVPDFGGYDASRDSGTLKPGGGFRF